MPVAITVSVQEVPRPLLLRHHEAVLLVDTAESRSRSPSPSTSAIWVEKPRLVLLSTVVPLSNGTSRAPRVKAGAKSTASGRIRLKSQAVVYRDLMWGLLSPSRGCKSFLGRALAELVRRLSPKSYRNIADKTHYEILTPCAPPGDRQRLGVLTTGCVYWLKIWGAGFFRPGLPSR